MRNKIDFNNLANDLKRKNAPIDFAKFGGPMYKYTLKNGHMKNGDTKLQEVEKEQNYFKKELNEIKSGNPKHKSNDQEYVIKNV